MDIHEIGAKFGMDSNGYASKHDVNFETRPDLPCYIPENADCLDDIITRDDIEQLVREWLKNDDAKEYLIEAYDGVMPTIHETFINNFVRHVYESLEWTCVETYLDNLLT